MVGSCQTQWWEPCLQIKRWCPCPRQAKDNGVDVPDNLSNVPYEAPCTKRPTATFSNGCKRMIPPANGTTWALPLLAAVDMWLIRDCKLIHLEQAAFRDSLCSLNLFEMQRLECYLGFAKPPFFGLFKQNQNVKTTWLFFHFGAWSPLEPEDIFLNHCNRVRESDLALNICASSWRL